MGSKFIRNANFSWTLFNNEINFTGSKSIGGTDFYYTSFNNKVNFNFASFNNEVDFSHASFDNEVDFSYSAFNNKACFSEVLFNRAKFLDNNFYYDKNKCKDNINDNNKIDFSHITINDYLELDNTNIQDDTEIIFDNMIFKDNKSYLSIMNIKKEISKLSLKDITIYGRINIQNVEVETFDFKCSVINSGLVNPVNFKVNNFANRESALFLKNEAYARNNIIDALEYKAKEIEMHKKDLSKEIKKKFNIKKFGDIFSIFLSSLYSDNGLNWIKSFLCTILFSIFFFTLSYNINYIPMFMYIFLSFTYFLFCNHNNKNEYNNKNIKEYVFISTIICLVVGFCQYIYFRDTKYIKELFNFIAPTDFSQISHENADTSYIYNCKSGMEIIFKGVFYFLGKIAFWYGSVQTVQAFRKFSKKE